MPHICTRCNNVFDSGEDILKGCPVCGWKKFMFVKNGAMRHDSQQSEPIITQSMGVKKPPKGRGRAKQQTKDRPVEELMRPSSPEKVSPVTPSQAHITITHTAITAHGANVDAAGAGPKDSAEKPGDDKLESIKITAPGTYELNLPSLFKREELIMAVKEGTYFIDLTSAFRKGKKE